MDKYMVSFVDYAMLKNEPSDTAVQVACNNAAGLGYQLIETKESASQGKPAGMWLFFELGHPVIIPELATREPIAR